MLRHKEIREDNSLVSWPLCGIIKTGKQELLYH